MNLRNPNQSLNLSIAAVERDTGIGKDTLRVWERRYGFPQPLRDEFDERSYPLEQVEKLRIIKRLLDQGQRPGRIVTLPIEELQKLSYSQMYSPQGLAGINEAHGTDLRSYMASLLRHDLDALRRGLHQALASMGINQFVTELVAPLNMLVGDAWMRGELEVFEEHLYTECITSVMHQAIHQVNTSSQKSAPTVLLTTFPQEQHGLGLLMVECLLALQGCHCLSLGVQTPLHDIARAAAAHHVNVVALSFSSSLNQKQLIDGLAELRKKLPESMEIWAGGSNPVLSRRPPAKVCVLSSLDQIAQQVQRWRRQHG
ncbi:MAG: MerR family transcriptional regulator [Betaproteobacteria bacterium]|nr:MerR family transcriptional regulator [Betaproteobacteria bacterium]